MNENIPTEKLKNRLIASPSKIILDQSIVMNTF